MIMIYRCSAYRSVAYYYSFVLDSVLVIAYEYTCSCLRFKYCMYLNENLNYKGNKAVRELRRKTVTCNAALNEFFSE